MEDAVFSLVVKFSRRPVASSAILSSARRLFVHYMSVLLRMLAKQLYSIFLHVHAVACKAECCWSAL